MSGLFIISGEPSSANYLSGIISALRMKGFNNNVYAVGSKRLEASGVEVIADPNEYSTVGIFQALRNLSKYADLFRLTISKIEQSRPGVALLMDLPDFNLRVAKKLKKMKIPAVYFIAPQVWAWRRSRIKLLRKYLDKLLVVFEFEKKFFESQGVACDYVGHPLLEYLAENEPNDVRKELVGDNEILVSLFPASRPSQFRAFAPLLCKASKMISENLKRKNIPVKFVMSQGSDISDSDIGKTTEGTDVKVFKGRQYDLMKSSDMMISSCGTTTFEGLVLNIPMVTFYRIHPVSYMILKPLIRLYVDYYSMPNILAGKQIVPELIQHQASPSNIAGVAASLILNGGLDKMRRHLEYAEFSIKKVNTSDAVAQSLLGYF